ncbi:uncharacterized protein LOC143891699 isoform X2 [Tasmannia lanceolata]
MSKPRLVKPRRHFVSRSGNLSTLIPDSRDDSVYNPLGTNLSVFDSSDRGNVGKMQAVRDRLDRWDRFSTELVQDTRVTNSSDGLDSGNFEFGKFDDAGFVFGGSVSNLNSENSGFSGRLERTLPDEMRTFRFESRTTLQSTDDKGSTFAAGGLGTSNSNLGEASEKGSFIFGSSSKVNSVPAQNSDVGFYGSTVIKRLPDEMRNLNIEGSGTPMTRNTKGSNFNNTSVSNSNLGGASEKGSFIFGSSSKINSVPAQNSDVGFDGSTVSKHLPDEMRKLNIKDTVTPATRNAKESNFSGTFTSPAPPFLASGKPSVILASSSGLSKPRLVKVRKHFVSRRGKSSTPVPDSLGDSVYNPFGLSSSAIDSSLRANDGKIQAVRDRLHSWNPFTTESVQDIKVTNSSDTPDSGSFEFGKFDDTGFVFGDSASNLNSKNSGFSESFERSLPDEMEFRFESRTTFQSTDDAGFTFTAGGPGTSNSNLGEASEEGSFIFGSRSKINSVPAQNSDVSFDGSTVTKQLPDEMRKLNIEDAMTSKSKFGKAYEKGSFEFRSCGKKSSFRNSSAGFDESMVAELPDEMRKLNMEIFGNGEGTDKSKGIDLGLKSNEKNGFVFGSSKNETCYFGGSTETMLQDEMKNLNIGSRLRDSSGRTDVFSSSSRTFTKDTPRENLADRIFIDSTVVTSISTPFTFQAGKQGNNFGMGQIPPIQQKEDLKPSDVARSFSPSSFTSSGSVLRPCTDWFENKSEYSFTSTGEGLGKPHVDLGTLKQDVSSMENQFSGLHLNLDFSAKRGAGKDTRPMKRRGKLKQSGQVHQPAGKDSISREKSFQENSEFDSPGSYSPMDFSPYQETLVVDQCPRETSAESEDSVHLHANHSSIETSQSVPMDARYKDLPAETHYLNVNDGDLKWGRLPEEGSKHHSSEDISDQCSLGQRTSGLGKECLPFKTENINIKDDSHIAAAETKAGISRSNVERQPDNGKTMSCFASSSENVGETNFTFEASSSSHGPLSAARRQYKKKSQLKAGQYTHTPIAKIDLASPSVKFFPHSSGSSQQELSQEQKGGFRMSESDTDKGPEVRQESISTASATATAQEACEKWRLRGNQAYANGYFSKAEDYYTRGVNCVSSKETSKSCHRALMLCYSNRAATRISLGRIRDALGDCMKAAAVDSNFLKVQVRAANCHLALGEIEDALKYFNKCLKLRSDLILDQKIITEASGGLNKAQQVADYMDQSAELLRQRTSDDAMKALQIITEALSISPYSEKLVEMKADTLLILRKYEEVVQLCEQTLDSAERNSASSGNGQLKHLYVSESIKVSSEMLWRWRVISRAYFYLGKLEEALDLLQKHEQVAPVIEKYGSKNLESSVAFSATVRELLHHKAAGNEAFQSGKHLEAVEHYTAALACNVESRPFAAICFCNRAAAHQALGHITEAIADCSLAIALDSDYPKAISRRATLHEMIRDYRQAIHNLQRLVSLLEKQTEDTANQSGKIGKSISSASDLRKARLRLSTVEEEAKKGIPLDMYLILGIESSSTSVDIKKAYRKAALKHHPDKAGQFLTRSENGDDGLWKEVADEVHKDADRLFKMIGEAYAVISDPTKRFQYDVEEEMRNAKKKGNGIGKPKTPRDVHGYSFEKSGGRRHWRDAWKSYENSQSHWSETSRSNR